MKAWEDLSNDVNVSLYYTGTSRNPKSFWYLDHGVKIERFEDGTIEVNNVMTASDHYDSVSSDEYDVFNNDGWLNGCYNVCINTFRRKLSRIEYLINLENSREFISEERMSMLKERESEMIKKLDRYLELMDNLPKFAVK